MKTIRNCSTRPLRVSLARGKVLHLGPRGTGQIHPDALGRPAVKKLLEAGDIEVIDDADARQGGSGVQSGQQSTRGHPPGTGLQRRGDR